MLLIKTNRDTLLKPLQIVAGIIERVQSHPILSNVLIRQDKEKTTFLASNSEIMIKTDHYPSLGSNQPFALTISAKKFQDILRLLSADAEVSLIKKDDQLQVKTNKSTFNLQTLPAESYPEIAEEDETEATITTTISQKTLKNLLLHTQFCIAQQNIRYYMNGLFLSTKENQLIGVSTDGHRLAFLATQLQQILPEQEVILPRKTALELSKLLSDTDEPVKIEYLHKKICFSFSNTVLVSKVIEGKFPDYNRVIPTNNNKSFEINRLDLLQTLQRVSILSNVTENFRGVRFILDSNNLRVICKNAEQEEAQEDLEITYQAERIDISMNINYLMDVLNIITSETVRLSLESENSSILITIPGNTEFQYVVMPMRM